MIFSLPILNSNELYKIAPSKIIALGLNYLEHIKESQSVDVSNFNNEIPSEPLLFNKTPNVLIPNNADIVIPKFIYQYDYKNVRVDHEAELAIIIKDKCKNINEADAFKHILGYTCFNDVSQRNFQKNDKSGWFRGKSLDTFGPIGPQIVLQEDIGDPQNLNIICRVNGEIRQSSNTSFMIFKLAQIISFISKNFTLEAGDIIITGTPSGVSKLKHLDIVEVEIENIGILKNKVIDESK